MFCEQLSIDLSDVGMDDIKDVRKYIHLEVRPFHSSLNCCILTKFVPLFIIFFSFLVKLLETSFRSLKI
jgi:hypothetical protein